MRIEIHVRPAASKTLVGGEYDGALIVRVVEPADGGRATAASLRAVAKALAIPQRSVTLARGATSRRKLIDIAVTTAASASITTTLEQLRTNTKDDR